MAEQDWIFDALIEYLNSPAWGTPVSEFFEEHYVHFEPEEENKLVYTEIHNKFRALVDRLLAAFVGNLGIRSEDFVKTCEGALAKAEDSDSIDKMVVEALMAFDDFPSFKRQMLRHRLQMELLIFQTMLMQATAHALNRQNAAQESQSEADMRIAQLEEALEQAMKLQKEAEEVKERLEAAESELEKEKAEEARIQAERESRKKQKEAAAYLAENKAKADKAQQEVLKKQREERAAALLKESKKVQEAAKAAAEAAAQTDSKKLDPRQELARKLAMQLKVSLNDK